MMTSTGKQVTTTTTKTTTKTTTTTTTNTLILLASKDELSSPDDEFFSTVNSLINDENKSEYINLIKLPSLQRIIIIFETHALCNVCFQMLRSHGYKVSYSVVDTKIPESTYLQLPDPGKKYIISPPPSPPVGWVDRPEDGPNFQIIHNPAELTGLLFKRLGHRIEHYNDDNDDDSTQQQHKHKHRYIHNHQDFINEKGQLEIPKVLLEELNGNPIIILDPAPDINDMKNVDGVSVNRIKTPMPPPSS